MQRTARLQHFLALECKNADTALTVICTYLPHQNNRRYKGGHKALDVLAELGEYTAERTKEGPVILIGDPNARTHCSHCF